jgi:predicted Zn-dependent protease
VRYLALMFLGVIAERQARFDDAEKQYRAALDTFRWGQAAPLALSHVLMRAGREQEAHETLAAHFTATRGRVVEPLWTYLANPATDLGPSLDQLRAEVWR